MENIAQTTGHDRIVAIALAIAHSKARGDAFRTRAVALRKDTSDQSRRDAQIFEIEASHEDDDVCTLCMDMKRACRDIAAAHAYRLARILR